MARSCGSRELRERVFCVKRRLHTVRTPLRTPLSFKQMRQRSAQRFTKFSRAAASIGACPRVSRKQQVSTEPPRSQPNFLPLRSLAARAMTTSRRILLPPLAATTSRLARSGNWPCASPPAKASASPASFPTSCSISVSSTSQATPSRSPSSTSAPGSSTAPATTTPAKTTSSAATRASSESVSTSTSSMKAAMNPSASSSPAAATSPSSSATHQAPDLPSSPQRLRTWNSTSSPLHHLQPRSRTRPHRASGIPGSPS